ncbi:unnamed protein product [Alopecurus aequalis]
MPLLPEKRPGGHHGGSSRRRRGDDGASLVDSSDGSITNSGASPSGSPDDEPWVTGRAYESRHHEIVASRLARLEFPASADGSDLTDLPNPPSIEILEALTRKSFHNGESRAALVEYQCHKFLSGRDRDSGESDLADVDMDSTCTEPDDDIPMEEYRGVRQELGARMTPIDTYTELDQEQFMELHLKHALYRIKAALLLQGKPVDELDAAALERKYPRDLIIKNHYFFNYVYDGYFGWYFDSDLCYKEFLTDYQRLVLSNDGGVEYIEYASWSKYQKIYCTPQADREYLKYWKTLVKKLKWLERHALIERSSYEWSVIRSKAAFQAVSIAAELPNMTLQLASLGLDEYIWNMRSNLPFLKDLDGIFYEIWKRMNKNHKLCFREALRQVYVDELFPANNRSMKNELDHRYCQMELLFDPCTKGLSEKLPEHRARELIAQEIHWRRGMQGSYERYARKKLKIAELIGLIPRDSIART